ncbi:hypothetical protein BDV96DRAFT_599655 [Lophiotrema nucula]|uniref:Uncharacterized protein n=1 Tax=Lophiotrema nucula TaxID=690887 RepID=A0A6A5Z7M8_9PLEO|nr:hypothetical protein BDV96DRAFT_599655 [Lophiotrema nucula]
MATPTDLTTTVSGKRCTRSQARTAATSTLTSTAAAEIVTPTELTSTTTTSEVQQIQSSAPAPPPSSTEEASSTAAASSAIGTDSPASSVAQTSVLANLSPSPPAAVVPAPGTDNNETAVAAAAAVSSVAGTSTPSATIAATSTSSSDAIAPASTPSSSDPPIPAESSVQAPSDQSSILVALPSNQASNSQPEQPQSTGASSGGSAGIISPDQGNPDDNGLTIAATGQTNVGGIVGGVVGGFVSIALISALLFLCLRRKRSKEPFVKWQKRVSEKDQAKPSVFDKLKAVPGKLKVIPEKIQAIPTGVGLLVAKLKGKKSGPAENPYRRHSVRSSVSSVYSVRSNGRSKSISEPPSRLRQQLRGFGDRMPSLKRSRTLLGKKQDSLVVGSQSPFPGIVEDPVLRNSKADNNPFADPGPLEPPRTLFALNPDPLSREGSPKPSRGDLDGLRDQQRPPLSPKPVAMSDRGSRDPFASIFDELEERNGSGTPEWLRDTSHQRSQSATTALRSHPPSSAYTASIYTTGDNPFIDPSDVPPVPSQPLPPNPPARPGNTYTPALPKFDSTSSAASRESNTSFFFGEPGPSRPTTNMFSSVSVIPRAGRQSDPFDLDRPEVLGFGNVNGRTVRASVTRQNSRKRTSSVPNWVSYDDGPYERASAVPGPLRKPSTRR